MTSFYVTKIDHCTVIKFVTNEGLKPNDIKQYIERKTMAILSALGKNS